MSSWKPGHDPTEIKAQHGQKGPPRMCGETSHLRMRTEDIAKFGRIIPAPRWWNGKANRAEAWVKRLLPNK
jgi:hypothetical protein